MAAGDLIFGAAAVFLAGVFAASAGWSVYLVILLNLTAAAAVFFAYRRSAGVLLIFMVFLVSGFVYFHLFLNLQQSAENISVGAAREFAGTVASEPKIYSEVQVFDLSLSSPYRGRIKVLLPNVRQINYGDVLELRGDVEPPASRVDRATAPFPEVEVLARERGFWLKQNLLSLKRALIGQFHRFLPADSAALLGGLTFGARSDFSPELKEAMAKSGTTHLVALSGYNISILVLAAAGVFGFWLRRRTTFFLTVAFILLFVLMAGGEASIVRAAVMGFLTLLAKETGRIYNFRNAVILAAFVMVLFDPTILRYDAGFQLSFLSLLGIAYLAPALKSRFRSRNGGFMNWRENLFTTASAQIMVLPVLLHYFQSFSPAAVLANALILGLVPATMFLGFVLAGVGLASFYLGLILAKLANLLLLYQIGVMRFFAGLDFAFTWRSGAVFTLAYYAAVLVFILWARSKLLAVKHVHAPD